MIYISLLLGINIGPHKRVPMAELKKLCEKMGFKNIHTLLASGNVIFEAEEKSADQISEQLEAELKNTFGFEVGVITVTGEAIKKMIQADPFNGIPVTKETRLYVTFYTEPPKEKINLPMDFSDKKGNFRILSMDDQAVYSVLTLGKTGTTDAMKIITKLFGKKITTRNWNTVQKLGVISTGT